MFDIDRRAIGNKMLEYRKKMGLTQAEVAERAGISDRTYADIERGNVNMRADTLLAICTALNVTPDLLVINSTEAETERRLDELFTDIKRRKSHEKKQIILAIEKCIAGLNEG